MHFAHYNLTPGMRRQRCVPITLGPTSSELHPSLAAFLHRITVSLDLIAGGGVGDLVAPPSGLAWPRECLRARDTARAVQTLGVAMIVLWKCTGLAGLL